MPLEHSYIFSISGRVGSRVIPFRAPRVSQGALTEEGKGKDEEAKQDVGRARVGGGRGAQATGRGRCARQRRARGRIGRRSGGGGGEVDGARGPAVGDAAIGGEADGARGPDVCAAAIGGEGARTARRPGDGRCGLTMAYARAHAGRWRGAHAENGGRKVYRRRAGRVPGTV